MATQPPVFRGVPASPRKAYQRQGNVREVSSKAARDRAMRIKIRDAFTCQNKQCGVLTHRLQCDHRVPLAYGGSEDDANCQALCERCHRVKSAMESQGHPLANPSDFPTTYAAAQRANTRASGGLDVRELFTGGC